jgi:hypothetical protein
MPIQVFFKLAATVLAKKRAAFKPLISSPR